MRATNERTNAKAPRAADDPGLCRADAGSGWRLRLARHWQMHRLAEKEALIAAVDQRLTAAPIPVPAAQARADLDLEALNFQPVSLTGAFRYNQTVTVFTSLANARGPASGPGYWVVTPFVLDAGGTVFVNRGFVPEAFRGSRRHRSGRRNRAGDHYWPVPPRRKGRLHDAGGQYLGPH
ncbi:SURF1 family protein [Devosia sp. A8/3-2]|nr:SURF1 family protein [Devosia sp. A8/3-2]